jgi:anaerobic magnesium-protoporphyrin IX monomethyl ester cyclase
MNILLINPKTCLSDSADYRHSTQFPVGLAIVKRILRNDGHSVYVLDINSENLSNNDVVNRLKFFKGKSIDFVGITAMSTQYAYVKWLSSIIKESLDNVSIVLGGCLARFNYDIVLLKTNIDICFLRDAERFLIDFVDSFDLKYINGVAYLDDDDNIVVNDLTCWEPESCDVVPDYEGFFINNIMRSNRIYTIMTSRGCPYNCHFCSRMFDKYTMRSIDSIKDELDFYNKNASFGFDYVAICDELALSSVDRATNISETVGKYGKWYANGRVNLVNDDILAVASSNNCFTITFGVESCSDDILIKMNKGANVENIYNAIVKCDKFGIRPNIQLIFGFLGENNKSFNDTLSFLFDLKDIFRRHGVSMGFANITPLPGSWLFDYCVNNGIINNNIDDIEKYLISLQGGFNKLRVNLTEWSDSELGVAVHKRNKFVENMNYYIGNRNNSVSISDYLI